jgi:hypothetical protein
MTTDFDGWLETMQDDNMCYYNSLYVIFGHLRTSQDVSLFSDAEAREDKIQNVICRRVPRQRIQRPQARI